MQRKFHRSKHAKLAGVAAGLADYFNIDVMLVRLAFVLTTFLNGIGVIAYIVLWIITDQEPHTHSET
ncbi:MAG: hypothetical protein A2660_00545 [Candidatus Doudnabacteria bacterium RIFCSPHIGHO2_01_FULL_45_18]|uniref:Phage shock protein PspC N-terminal domain-containing protein n=1 Tax=Candidatus Doudnabacteria bacterium RIFCSPHIGHO2_01_FULL_45_18 TaxID=1817823 RepID=A0A1F5NR55_9BACT|nr:MAG: hypothetical protein A2660_00545 [Candidatus Doudnabacteria bacterium RIFCSPHIGHO2_01_FULL_45_18]